MVKVKISKKPIWKRQTFEFLPPVQKSTDIPPPEDISMFLNLPPKVLDVIFENVNMEDLIRLSESSKFINQFLGSLETFQARVRFNMQFESNVDNLKASKRFYKSLSYNGLQDMDCYRDLNFAVDKYQKSLEELELFLMPIKADELQIILKKLERLSVITLSYVKNDESTEISEDLADLKNLKDLTVTGSDMKLLRHFKNSKLTTCELTYKSDRFKDNIEEDIQESRDFFVNQHNLTHLTLKDTSPSTIFNEDTIEKCKFQLQFLNIQINDSIWGDQEIKGFGDFLAPSLTKIQVIFNVNMKGDLYLKTILSLPLLTDVNFKIEKMKFSEDESEMQDNNSIKIARFLNASDQRSFTAEVLSLLSRLQGLETFECSFYEINHDLLKVLDGLPNLKKIRLMDCTITEMISLPNIEEMIFENGMGISINRFLECNRQIKKLTLICLSANFYNGELCSNDWSYTIQALKELEFLDMSSFGYNEELLGELIRHKNLKKVILPRREDIEDLKENIEVLKMKMEVIFK